VLKSPKATHIEASSRRKKNESLAKLGYCGRKSRFIYSKTKFLASKKHLKLYVTESIFFIKSLYQALDIKGMTPF